MKADLKLITMTLVFILFAASAFTAYGLTPLPGYWNVNVSCANDNGIAYDYNNNGMYMIGSTGGGGGTNALHISTDPSVYAGQFTVTNAQSGVIYATDTGGRGYNDDIILMLAVNGTIPDNFRVHIKTSGYNWTPVTIANAAPTDITYRETGINETYTKEDFIYGPSSWKPAQGSSPSYPYPLYYGENTADPLNNFSVMFISTHVGTLSYAKYPEPNDNGSVKIEYSFENMPSYAAFNIYGWCNIANVANKMAAWTNDNVGSASKSGYLVQYTGPTANFTANTTAGQAPLSVQFNDTSSNVPTSWSWDFGDGSTSTGQNPVHTYSSAGTYTVSLTATNAGGSNTMTRNDLITVSPSFDESTAGALLVSENIPRTLMLGHTYNANITFQNTGSQAWSEGDLVRMLVWGSTAELGITGNANNLGCGYEEFRVPEGVSVQPGETYTWQFSMTPNTAGYTCIGLIMAHNRLDGSVVGFGQADYASIIVTPATFDISLGNAWYQSNDLPSTMVVGQTYNVSVTYMNNGWAPWSEADSVRLLGFGDTAALGLAGDCDNYGSGYPEYAITGDPVLLWQLHTWNFTVTPTAPGNYMVGFAMVQNSGSTVTPFGGYGYATVNVVSG